MSATTRSRPLRSVVSARPPSAAASRDASSPAWAPPMPSAIARAAARTPSSRKHGGNGNREPAMQMAVIVEPEVGFADTDHVARGELPASPMGTPFTAVLSVELMSSSQTPSGRDSTLCVERRRELVVQRNARLRRHGPRSRRSSIS